MEETVTRLNKFLSEIGFCSRREADKLIEQGRVTINGIVPEMGTKVSPNDEVRVNGKLVRDNHEKPIYLAFNKPVGIECTTNLDVRDNIVDYINYPKRIFPIGRLDKASEGLIFMTNDGDIVNKILRARNNHEKEYIVTVNRPITDRFIERMGNGVPILDTITRKWVDCSVFGCNVWLNRHVVFVVRLVDLVVDYSVFGCVVLCCLQNPDMVDCCG